MIRAYRYASTVLCRGTKDWLRVLVPSILRHVREWAPFAARRATQRVLCFRLRDLPATGSHRGRTRRYKSSRRDHLETLLSPVCRLRCRCPHTYVRAGVRAAGGRLRRAAVLEPHAGGRLQPADCWHLQVCPSLRGRRLRGELARQSNCSVVVSGSRQDKTHGGELTRWSRVRAGRARGLFPRLVDHGRLQVGGSCSQSQYNSDKSCREGSATCILSVFKRVGERRCLVCA